MSISTVNSSVNSNINSNLQQTVSSLLKMIQNQPTLMDLLSLSSTSTTSSSGDILDLSSQGQQSADQLYQLLGSYEQSGVQNSVNKSSQNVQKQLSEAFSQNGIDTSKEIDLQLDSKGNVTVSNDNSQKKVIEDLIKNNADLKKEVVQYLHFMQAVAPTLTSINSSPSSQSGLEQLLSSLSSTSSSSSSSSSGPVTFALQGSDFETSYQNSSGNAVVLASSQA